jgi:TonB family protein
MRNDSLNLPFVSSLLIHLIVLALGSALVQSNLRRQEFLPIALVDLPPSVHPPQAKKVEAPSETKKAPPREQEKIKDTKSPAKTEIVKPEKAPPAPAVAPKDEIAKPMETKSITAPRMEASSIPSTARVEGGGSEAGAGALFGKGDVGVVPGSGTAGGGGGTASSGLGRGSGAPGLPVQQTILRTNREAKPLQTVRATYPAMALRAGLEADVTLKIEVDPQGNVTRAEIVKGGGAGFDEEALKAVKQSRFEPAQRDGQNVPAEFTFVYRFRLQR